MLQGVDKEKDECALEFLKNIFTWKGPELALMQRDVDNSTFGQWVPGTKNSKN